MTPDGIPPYLEEVYWWAYMHPWAVRFFERQWLLTLILFGNYLKLRDGALKELGTNLSGRTLQISCCYGNLTPRLAELVTQSGGTLDVIDILPVQLENVRRKIPAHTSANFFVMDAAALDLPGTSYDQVLLFFLLHEQPQDYREKTMREAFRVLRPGGTIVIVDYGKPSVWHPLHYLAASFIRRLEPFAADLWKKELAEVLPREMAGRTWQKTCYFGGLYQKLVSTG